MDVRFSLEIEEQITDKNDYENFTSNVEKQIFDGEVLSLEQGEETFVKVDVTKAGMFNKERWADNIENLERVENVSEVVILR